MFSALPARPLHGRPPVSLAGPVFSFLGLLMFGAALGFLLVFLPPDMVTDWQVRDTARLLRDGTVTDTDCSGQDLIEICNMTVSAPVGEGVVQRRVHYMFISSQSTPFVVQAVADPARPGLLTTDLALDAFWNRLASLVAGSVIVALLLAAGGWAALRGYNRARRWRKADAVPVALRLVSRQRVRGGEIWTVRSDDGRQERWPVPRRAAPFVLGSTDEILGLQQTSGGAIMPLDGKLRWVDLSAPERAAVSR